MLTKEDLFTQEEKARALTLAHRTCTKYQHEHDLPYLFNEHQLVQFAEQLVQAERAGRLAAEEASEKLSQEMLTERVFSRLVGWLAEEPPRPAVSAFTAGIERQIAYALEMSVLPEVKSLKIRLANAQAEIDKLRTKA